MRKLCLPSYVEDLTGQITEISETPHNLGPKSQIYKGKYQSQAVRCSSMPPFRDAVSYYHAIGRCTDARDWPSKLGQSRERTMGMRFIRVAY